MLQGRRVVLSACLLGTLAQLGCESTETKTEAAPIVGVLELPIVQRNGGNPMATAAKVEISPSELRVDGEPVLTLQNGKVPPAEAVGYVLPKLKLKLAGKGGLA